MYALHEELAYAPASDATSVEQLTIIEGRYEARLAANAAEIESALRLRHVVFNVELADDTNADDIEQDAFDLVCRHLIVVDRETDQTVGTYRLNSFETAGSAEGFYSHGEFSIEDLPTDVLANGASEHEGSLPVVEGSRPVHADVEKALSFRVLLYLYARSARRRKGISPARIRRTFSRTAPSRTAPKLSLPRLPVRDRTHAGRAPQLV